MTKLPVLYVDDGHGIYTSPFTLTRISGRKLGISRAPPGSTIRSPSTSTPPTTPRLLLPWLPPLPPAADDEVSDASRDRLVSVAPRACGDRGGMADNTEGAVCRRLKVFVLDPVTGPASASERPWVVVVIPPERRAGSIFEDNATGRTEGEGTARNARICRAGDHIQGKGDKNEIGREHGQSLT